MAMALKRRAAFGFIAGFFIPLALGAFWGQLSPALQVLPALLFLLVASVIARFSGFGPALLYNAVSATVLTLHVFRYVALDKSSLLLRVGLYLIVSITIASISRRRSEEAREAEERYRSLVELSPDGVVVVDENLTILFANTSLVRLLGGTDPVQIIGKELFDFAPDDSHTLEERKRQLSSGHHVPLLRTKWRQLDGTTIDVETAGVPLHKEGKLFFQGFVRDISGRKKVEANLEESRRRLQALFDTALDAILFFDSNGCCIDANPAATRLFGYTHDEIGAMNIDDLVAPDHGGRKLGAFREGLADGGSSGALSILRKDDTTREIEFRVVANVVPGLHVLLIHDMTERKEAERAIQQLSGRLLRAQDEERRRIARQLHDTTAQNLATIRFNLVTVNRSAAADEPRVAEAVKESIALIEESISEIRTLSYLLHPPLIDEAGLVAALRWFARGFEMRSGIQVSLDLSDDLDGLPPETETSLFRIIQEALTNVQRHADSRVACIRLRTNHERIHLEISDEGVGLPEHLQGNPEAAFASGVGLAGIRQRARDLGGDMQLESSEAGTKVAIELPIGTLQ
jgi:PAS domain S-box-containing protein